MEKPKMILFDYGQTLVNENKFDGVAGTKAVMQYATRNKHSYTPEEVQAAADALNAELGRANPDKRLLFQIEIPNHMFTSFLYQSMGIELPLTPAEIDRIFWPAAAPGVPTDGIETFLAFLKEQSIRTGVISNISYCGEVVKERTHSLLGMSTFEFIIATSEYLFRKPNPKIFELVLEKAGLQPEDVWYVGDNFLCDVVGARNAGIFPVLYTGASSGSPENTGVLTISHWNELKRFLLSIPEKQTDVASS